jgi:scyllo-inositol 2-dehydrogenase (NADP+)
LLAGRDVVVDKPFTNTSREAWKLDEIAKARGRLLSAFQNRRWDGDFLTVRRLLESGELGRLVLYESHYDRYRPALRANAWRETTGPGSGLLFDIGPHLVDQALLLFGMPDSIKSDVRIERDHAVVDDAFDILLEYPRLRVLLRASMLRCEPGPRFLLQGTLGTYRKYGLDPQEDATRAGGQPGSPGWGEEDPSQWGTLSAADSNSSITHRAVPTLRLPPVLYQRARRNLGQSTIGRYRRARSPRDPHPRIGQAQPSRSTPLTRNQELETRNENPGTRNEKRGAIEFSFACR